MELTTVLTVIPVDCRMEQISHVDLMNKWGQNSKCYTLYLQACILVNSSVCKNCILFIIDKPQANMFPLLYQENDILQVEKSFFEMIGDVGMAGYKV